MYCIAAYVVSYSRMLDKSSYSVLYCIVTCVLCCIVHLFQFYHIVLLFRPMRDMYFALYCYQYYHIVYLSFLLHCIVTCALPYIVLHYYVVILEFSVCNPGALFRKSLIFWILPLGCIRKTPVCCIVAVHYHILFCITTHVIVFCGDSHIHVFFYIIYVLSCCVLLSEKSKEILMKLFCK